MGRSVVLLTILFFGVFAAAPISAQSQPEQGRGQGFRGGRGLGAGPGKRVNSQLEPSGNVAATREATHPVIANHGGVVQLPLAAQQPRPGTKLLVDLTSGGDVDKLNAGLDKVAKYLNIYAGGGAKPVNVQIAVVFHGDATLSVLKPDAYAAKFKTDGNPNLQLLQQLHESGVELYVCGQSLISKGSAPEDVAVFVKTAVSALTAVVNLQADGYAYIPIAHAAPAVPPKLQAVVETNAANSNTADQHRAPMPVGGMGRGPGAMPGMQEDMSVLHAMFADRGKIKRTVTNLPNGAEAITESEDEAIAKMLKAHVPAMEERVLGNKPLPPMTFHPIFVELIKHAKAYTLTYEETGKGMKVQYQSDDPYVVMLVQEHAKLVSRFIENGMEEIHVPYTLPKTPKPADTDRR